VWVPALEAEASKAQRSRAQRAVTALLAGQVDSALASGALRLGGAGSGREPASGQASSCALQRLLDLSHPVTLKSMERAGASSSHLSLVADSAVVDLSKQTSHHRRNSVARVKAGLLQAHSSAAGHVGADLNMDVWLTPGVLGIRVRGTVPGCEAEARLAGVRLATVQLWPFAWPTSESDPLRLRLSFALGDVSALAARLQHLTRAGMGARGRLELTLSGLADTDEATFLANSLARVRLLVWRAGAEKLRDPEGTAAKVRRLHTDPDFYRQSRWFEPSARAGTWVLSATSPTHARFIVRIPAEALSSKLEFTARRPRLIVRTAGRKAAVTLGTQNDEVTLPMPAHAHELNATLELTSELHACYRALQRGERLVLSVEAEFDSRDGVGQRMVVPIQLPAITDSSPGGRGARANDAEAAPSSEAAGEGTSAAEPPATWKVLAGQPRIRWGPVMETLLFWEKGVSFDIQVPLHNPLNFGVEVHSLQVSATFNDPDGASTFPPDARVPLMDELAIPDLNFYLAPNETDWTPRVNVGLRSRQVETLTRAMNEVVDHHRLCADLLGTVRFEVRHGLDMPFVVDQPFDSPHVSLYSGGDDHACDFMVLGCNENFTREVYWTRPGLVTYISDGSEGRAAREARWRRYAIGGDTSELTVEILNASNIPPADARGGLSDPYVEVSVGCEGRTCSSCSHCVASSVVQSTAAPVWNERLSFGVVPTGRAIAMRLYDRHTSFFAKLLLARNFEVPWPNSSALIELRSTPRSGSLPIRLFTRLRHVPRSRPPPPDGSRVLIDGGARQVATNLVEQALRVGEGFAVKFTVCVLSGQDADEIMSALLDPLPRPLSDPPTTPGKRARDRERQPHVAQNTYAPSPAFALVVFTGQPADPRELIGAPCGSEPCPGCAGIPSSLAVTFDGSTVRNYVDGVPTYQRAGLMRRSVDDGQDHDVVVRVDVASKQLTVTVDDDPVPVLQQQLVPSMLAPLAQAGGFARVGFTAGTGWSSTRPLVLRDFAVSVARPSAVASIVRPAPEQGVVGHARRTCEMTLQPRTECGLPTTLGIGWKVYVQAMSSAMEGSVAIGPPIDTWTPPGSANMTTSTTITLRFVAEQSGIHRVLVHEADTQRTYDVGEVLVVQ